LVRARLIEGLLAGTLDSEGGAAPVREVVVDVEREVRIAPRALEPAASGKAGGAAQRDQALQRAERQLARTRAVAHRPCPQLDRRLRFCLGDIGGSSQQQLG
jgi:hypothetical protein